MKDAVCFDNITITNDVMFGSVFQEENDCKELLQRILGIEIEELKIVEKEKTIQNGISSKGIRIDIYARDIEDNSYDIEMQLVNTGELALRSRYYHSEMDGYQIRKGQKYWTLKESIVIFICAFDLFGYNQSIYTFENRCKEVNDLLLDDKRKTIFVNILGDRRNIRPEMKRLLDYLETGNPSDKFTKNLQSKVEKLRRDHEWRENYMTLEMKMDLKYEEGKTEGIEQTKLEDAEKIAKEFGISKEEALKILEKK